MLFQVALNIATVSMSVDLKGDGIFAALLHPGWVQTDLGGPRAITTVQQSVEGMITRMKTFTDEHTGSFYDFRGDKISW